MEFLNNMKPQTKSLLEWFIVANLTVIFLGSILIVWLMFFQGSNPMVVRGDAQALPTVQPELDETGNFIPKILSTPESNSLSELTSAKISTLKEKCTARMSTV